MSPGVSVLLMSGLSADSPVSLDISPNLQQFFSGDSSVSLRCSEDGRTAEGWTVKRTTEGSTEVGGDAGSGPSCVLDLSVDPGGSFWCETSSGTRSYNVSIIVLDKGLILEIPALPVKAGSDVTLRCRRRSGDITSAFFFIDSRRLGSGAEHVLREVQQADEGSYWCSTDRFGRSPHSFLRVRDPPLPRIITAPPLVSVKPGPAGSPPPPPPPSSSSASPPPPPPLSCASVLRLLCHLLVICPYCVCSVLLLLMCCSRNSGHQPDVSMETGQPAELEDVTTEQEL
ncbi:PREDICTED: uncharacterized protein LOC107105172 [Cyprinodon variegatus]|uniref:uncharacterized protein LOC107105172 n=1 Tax=Cyprinodon variegatus TaxID=28743 RepID=UPI00074258EF|nr:PREDICTED: uncharacterized protein LOC107105172 [Cyprinodon variegatus]